MTSPHPLPLNLVVERYEKAIVALETAGDTLAPEHVLEVLIARDTVHAALYQQSPLTLQSLVQSARATADGKPKLSEREWHNRVRKLDARLKRHQNLIRQAAKLMDWQEGLHPPDREWLQRFEDPVPLSDRFDWLWKVLAIGFLTVALTLLTDIITRFTIGGLDASGTTAILASGILSLLSGGGVLTKFGQVETEKIFVSLNVPQRWWDETRCGISIACLLLLFGFQSYLPNLADNYVQAAEQQPTPARKEVFYNRAIALSPNSTEAYVQLGNLYKDRGDTKEALSKYKAAWDVGKREIAEDIVEIYLEDKDYPKADHWLRKALQRVSDQQNAELTYRQRYLIEKLGRIYLEQRKSSKAIDWFQLGKQYAQSDPLWQYRMLTYLGWTRLNQGALPTAERQLRAAMQLHPKLETNKSHRRYIAHAHCLLAQVLNRLPKRTVADWKTLNAEAEQCVTLLSPNKSEDEETWYREALTIQQVLQSRLRRTQP